MHLAATDEYLFIDENDCIRRALDVLQKYLEVPLAPSSANAFCLLASGTSTMYLLHTNLRPAPSCSPPSFRYQPSSRSFPLLPSILASRSSLDPGPLFYSIFSRTDIRSVYILCRFGSHHHKRSKLANVHHLNAFILSIVVALHHCSSPSLLVLLSSPRDSNSPRLRLLFWTFRKYPLSFFFFLPTSKSPALRDSPKLRATP